MVGPRSGGRGSRRAATIYPSGARCFDRGLAEFQIIKKRMLSSRTALANTVENRLEALASRTQQEEAPTRSEVRELQGDRRLNEKTHSLSADQVMQDDDAFSPS